MEMRRMLVPAVLAGMLAAGCGGGDEEATGQTEETELETEAVPPGAVPAAADARPGIEPELSEIQLTDSAGAVAGTPGPNTAGGAAAADSM